MIIKINNNKYSVESSNKKSFYAVSVFNGEYKCNCKAFEFRKEGELCKHIYQTKMFIKQGEKNL